MAKTNYSKAEDGFGHSAKAHLKYILLKKTNPTTTIEEAEYLPDEKMRGEILERILIDMRSLNHLDSETYAKMECSNKEVEAWIQKNAEIDITTWKKINFLRYKILRAKEELIVPKQKKFNKLWIEQERIVHQNKQHKIKDGWWPV